MSSNEKTSGENDINDFLKAQPAKKNADNELEDLISMVIATKRDSPQHEKKSAPRNGKPKAVPANAPMNRNSSNNARSSSNQNSAQKKPAGDAANRRQAANRTGNRPAPVANKPVNSAKASGTRNSPAKKANNQSRKKAWPVDPVEEPVSIVAKKSKKKWSGKKKAGVTLGVIFLAACLVCLAIWLIISHYVGMIQPEDRKKTDGRPTYSDIDNSRSDTINEDTETEKLKKTLEQSASNIMKDKDVFNVLLIGEDLRTTSDSTEGVNTDVMMLFSLNTKEKTITMTSFMRDIYLYLPDSGYSNRLNAAYYHNGAESVENTIEKYFGVSIDKYVIVNFYSFIEIVETFGGLNITVTDEEAECMQAPMAEQNKYLGNKWGSDYLNEGGEKLLLNGNQALAYARVRKTSALGTDGGDYQRTKRQRIVIAEMINKAKKSDLATLDKLVTKILKEGNVKSNIETADVAALLLNSFDYMNYEIQEVRVPADGTFTNEVIYGMDVLSIDFTLNTKIIQETIYGKTNVVDEDKQIEAGYDSYGNFIGDNGYYDKDGNWVGQMGYYDDDGDFHYY